MDGLILIDCLNALTNCKLLSCRMCATLDGIHWPVLVNGRSLRRIQDSEVMSGPLRHRVDVCGH